MNAWGSSASRGGPDARANRGADAGSHPDRFLEATHELWAAIEDALSFPEDAKPRGLGPFSTKLLHASSVLLLLMFAVGWTWSISEAAGASVADPAEPPALQSSAWAEMAVRGTGRPPLAYLLDVATSAFVPPRGESGRLRAMITDPGDSLPPATLPHGARLALAGEDGVPAAEERRAPPGIWRLAVSLGEAMRPLEDFRVITTRPLSDRREGRIGRYVVGTWPSERQAREGYTTPSGLIEVTPENQDTPISEHFTLRDFLTKGQANVWPKYLLVDTRLVDKLELVLAELRKSGHETHGIIVMSGFRTPSYNTSGGDPSGRANYSRHVYGDAADVYVDNDGDGWMDDLNGDGRSTMADARVMLRAVERVEQAHPALVGGAGVYPGGTTHGPFIHIDARGYPARWTGEAQ